MTNSLDSSDPFSPTHEEIETAHKMIAACLSANGRRSLDDERVFMENLLVQRLNFLLVVFSIFVAAGFAARTSVLSAIVFFAGTCICYLMAKIVYRAHVKHHWIMRLFYNQPAEESDKNLPHAIKFINDAMKTPEREKRTAGSVSRLVGARIPTVCWCFLLICALVSVAFASDVGGTLAARLRSTVGGTEAAVTFMNAAGKETLLKGRISHEVHESVVEVTVVEGTGKNTVLVLPVERFVNIER